MKKLLYCAAALATLLFAGSCQRENLEPAVEGATVSYTVTVPGVMATKASAYTGPVDSLVYEVHGANGRLYKNNAKFENGVATLDIEVVKDQDFTILFWAQKSGVAFDTQSLKAVKMPATFTANVEDYEAFYGVDEFTYTTDITATNSVELTRAVSMLNVATTEASLKVGGVANSNIAVTASSVTVTGLNKILDVETGAATDPYTESSALACSYAVPATYETVEFGETDYVYVAKNFVGFAGDAEKPYKSLTNVVLNITTSEGEIEHVIPSVPFQRNYKTNIIGNLISANAAYDVTLTDTWVEEEYTKIVATTAIDLQTMINNAPAGETMEISLSGDINFGDLSSYLATRSSTVFDRLTIPSGKSIVLNLNGYSISGLDETEVGYSLILNQGNLVLTNTSETVSKIALKSTVNSGWSRYSSVISTSTGSTLTVEDNIVVEHLGGTDMSYGIDVLTNGGNGSVKATINGATVKSSYRAIRQFLNSDSCDNELVVMSGSTIIGAENNKSIFFQDPSAKANKGKLTVEEGAKLIGDVYLFVTDGSTEWPVDVTIPASVFDGESTVTYKNVPAGYAVENNDGVWTVVFHPAAKIGSTEYATLQEAFNVGGDIVLLCDVTLAEPVVLAEGKTVSLDLNNKVITTVDPTATYAIINQGTLTLQNGTVSARGIYNGYGNGGENVPSAKLVIENGSYNAMGTNGGAAVFNYGELVVKGGEFESNGGYGINNQSTGVTSIKDASVRGGVYNLGTLSITNSTVYQHISGRHCIYNWEGNVTVESGNFDSESGNELILADGEGATVTLNGGTYNKTAKSWLFGAATGKNITFNIYGGTFNGYVNNPEGTVDTIRPYGDPILVHGGTFNFDPTNWLAEGFMTVAENGLWTVTPLPTPVAKVGNTEYLSIDEAVANWTNGSTLTLLADVTLSDVVTFKSTEHHILNLDTYTLTAASGKHAIEITCEGRSSASYALTVNADATNPGGITATGKSCIYYKKSGTTKDRPIILINNGVFTGSYSINSTSNGNTNCPQIWINGGVFNSYMNLTKNMLRVSGGTFHGAINCTGDSSAYREIKGGRFKSWQFMTADAATKFWVGSGNGNYDVGVYVDAEGYLVVGGPVITAENVNPNWERKEYSAWSNYLKYSSAATHGLYYEK